MIIYAVDFEPTKEQLAEIDGEIMNRYFRSIDKWIVTYDDETYELPEWLEGKIEVNVPGEPHVCQNCGYPI